jgi:ABC-type Mn2+/Zn2+ transport system ATPase subunit
VTPPQIALRAGPATNAKVAVIEIKNLVVGYGERVILRDVTLTVCSGEFWFFVGPNGEGKSTLLKAILGAIEPVSGSIELNAELSSRQRLGFVPQRCDLNPTLRTTVREFIALGLVGIGGDRRDEAEHVALALAKVGLAGFERREYWSLSGGQRQRALVARALVRKPRLLILDEPTNGLDLAAEAMLLDALVRLNRDEHTTILFVAHNLTLAAEFATDVALFSRARVRIGHRDDVLRPECLAEAYGVPIYILRTAGGVGLRVGKENVQL